MDLNERPRGPGLVPDPRFGVIEIDWYRAACDPRYTALLIERMTAAYLAAGAKDKPRFKDVLDRLDDLLAALGRAQRRRPSRRECD
jgi:hypothetical protein